MKIISKSTVNICSWLFLDLSLRLKRIEKAVISAQSKESNQGRDYE
jgi:hypothetical protein